MNLLEYMEKMLQDDIGAKSVTINANSASVLQTVGGFTDVKKSDYSADPVVWAAEKGMVTGGTFGGDRPCTRSMAVSYMWKADTAPNFNLEDGVLTGYAGDGGNVVIPGGVTGLGYWAFYQCASLRSVVIPEGVTWMDVYAFYECENLTSVAIPGSLEKIEVDVFQDCPNITDVYYGGSEAQWKKLGCDYLFDDATPTIHYNSKMPQQTQQSVNTGFTDVPGTADYAQAVKWAVDKGVTSGTSATAFSPDSVCTRGQIVTFLHRALAK